MIDELWNDHSFRVLFADLLKTKTKGEDEQKMRLKILLDFIKPQTSSPVPDIEAFVDAVSTTEVHPPKAPMTEEERKAKEVEVIVQRLEDLRKMPFVPGKPRVIRIPMIAQSALKKYWHEAGLNNGPEPEFQALDNQWQITLR